MTKHALLMVLLAVMLPVAAATEWQANTVHDFVADENQRHPRSKTLVLVQPVDAPFGADACFTYANWRADKPNRGKVKVEIQVTRQSSPSGPVELIREERFGTERVRGNTASGCVHVGLIQAGDTATFGFKFKGAPALRPARDDAGKFQFSGTLESRDCTEGNCLSDGG